MSIKRLNDKRSYYRRVMDFIFWEKLTQKDIPNKNALVHSNPD